MPGVVSVGEKRSGGDTLDFRRIQSALRGVKSDVIPQSQDQVYDRKLVARANERIRRTAIREPKIVVSRQRLDRHTGARFRTLRGRGPSEYHLSDLHFKSCAEYIGEGRRLPENADEFVAFLEGNSLVTRCLTIDDAVALESTPDYDKIFTVLRSNLTAVCWRSLRKMFGVWSVPVFCTAPVGMGGGLVRSPQCKLVYYKPVKRWVLRAKFPVFKT